MAFSFLAYLLLQRETHSSVDSGGRWVERTQELGDNAEEDRKNGIEKISILSINFSFQTNNGVCLCTKQASSGTHMPFLFFCHVPRVQGRGRAEETMGGVYYK